MARIIHDTRLETRAARARLRPRKKPYYKTLVPGRMALGYHRKRQHTPGRWLVRVYRFRGQSENQNRQVKLPLTEWSCAVLASWPA
jgi:hypothetical protein